MPAFEGGNPTPVTTGGAGDIEARAAVPVYVVPGPPPVQQRARRVVAVTSGPIEGRAAVPVYDAGVGAVYTDESALPVFVVSGSLGGSGVNPALAYTNKVKALAPIAYWPLADASGSVATDESGNGRNGSYSNVTLGATGIGDGRTAATFNGSTSVVNVFSASLQAAFSGDEGTLSAWFKVVTGGWTDGLGYRPVTFEIDGNNRVLFQKQTTNGDFLFFRASGGVTKQLTFASGSPAGWVHIAQTWSKSADQLKWFFNGAQAGTTQTGLASWAGSLTATGTVIGAINTTPSGVFSGSIAHVAVFTSALSAANITALATVP